MSEWIQQLNSGNEVFVTRDRSIDGPFKVKRLTNTLVVVEYINAVGNPYERKFNRVTGRLIGSNIWHSEYLVQDTPEVRSKVALIEKYRKATKLRDSIVVPRDGNGIDRFIEAVTPFVKVTQ